MTDSLTQLKTDMRYAAATAISNSKDVPARLVSEFADRLEALQKQPVAYMTHHDRPMLFSTVHEAASYCEDDEKPISLIRGD